MAANRQIELMRNARARSSIDTETLTNIIHQGADRVRSKREAWTRVEKTTGAIDTTKLPIQYAQTSREDLYHKDGLPEGRAALVDMVQHSHTWFEHMTPRYHLSNYSPFGLSTTLLVPTFKQMGTPEQQRKWLGPMEKGETNWAYAQTELGHGTFVRGLETTATFDKDGDSFILNSPTITSTKYWPGSMGFSATHAVVMARLITQSTDHGVHAFIVQLRDPDTGVPTPGLELGDIGPMMSYNQNDNGYARFDNVAIPRENMLMGQASVDRDGVYHKAKHDKSAYTTMLAGRTMVTKTATFELAKAVTIAVRYSTVREQGYQAFGNESEEATLMQFKSQQFRLLTGVATAYAMLFATWRLEKAQKDFERKVKAGDYGTMTGLHALTAGVKSWATAVAFDAAADTRKCCGGHGYLAMSGLPETVSAIDALSTLEGDNTVMMLQTARYLMKIVEMEPEMEKLPQEVSYLFAPITTIEVPDVVPKVETDFMDPETQLRLFKHRAAKLVRLAFSKLQQALKQGKTKAQAWQDHTLILLSAARAHVVYLVLQDFTTQVSTIQDPAIRQTLDHLRSLLALSQITSPYATDNASFHDLDESQLDSIRDSINHLLEALVPEAIALVDAWDFSDASLASAIGMKDGDVYERLMSWTSQLPINIKAKEVGGVGEEVWEKWLRPRKVDVKRLKAKL